ncbi:MAG TPA: hypothetical protein VJU84_07700 [Pyrinomonadaceae bacterium]|nr:hypothetical protein [Pyrinomonadaceae bacterium]
MNIVPRTIFLILVLFSLCAWPAPAYGQEEPAKNVAATQDPKAEAIIARAVEVLGGSNYLNVKTVIGRGFYTTFHDGVSQLPARFLDYIAYPDKERTEFTGGGIKAIQTNVGNTGWVYDSTTKTIGDMKEPQIADFKRSMRTTLENLLQGWWRKEGAVLTYAGRREAGLARRNETVRLTYPDGYSIEYEFGARDGLPAKMIYKRTKKKPNSDETEETNEEDRLAKPITVDGVTAPWVIDHYVNGIQTSRINYESIEYNKPLPDSLFAKPDNVKAIK